MSIQYHKSQKKANKWHYTLCYQIVEGGSKLHFLDLFEPKIDIFWDKKENKVLKTKKK